MDTNNIVGLCVASAAIACLLFSWFYEHQLNKANTTIRQLKKMHLDRTYDWLSARAEAQVYRDQAWSFNDQLTKYMLHADDHAKSMDDHLVTLFDEQLMLGNND